MLIGFVAFRPQDLRLWQYHEPLLQKTISKWNYDIMDDTKTIIEMNNDKNYRKEECVNINNNKVLRINYTE